MTHPLPTFWSSALLPIPLLHSPSTGAALHLYMQYNMVVRDAILQHNCK